MLKPRTPFLVSLLAGVIGAIVAKLVAATLKAIFDVTVQDFWKDTIAPYLSAKVGPWSTSMLEAIGPCWAGFGSAFLLMFVVEMAFAWRRSHIPAIEPAPTLQLISGAKETEEALPVKAGVIIEVSLLDLPTEFPEAGWVDAIDFYPHMRFTDVRRGKAGSKLRFLPDDWEVAITYRLRITLVTPEPILASSCRCALITEKKLVRVKGVGTL